LGLDFTSIGTPDTRRPNRPFPATLNSANRLANTLSGNVPFNPVTTGIDVYAFGNRRNPVIYPDNRDDNIMVSLKVNLPIWRKKIRAGVAEARMLEEAATHEKRRRALELDKAAQMAIFTVEDGARRHGVFKDSLTPQAKRSYDSLQIQYATGALGASFLDVLDSIQTLLVFELEQVRAARDWQIGAADLEYLTGGPWGVYEDTQIVEAN
ncbi:MAG: TolC family protein, partial [Candidatus Hydrogenedentes bacterium]|nr:TolC family protein [Candidatus Hydrogenedentota bacterium]